ncbi:MAG: hypothetical protein JWR02_2823 [Mucilaginibacter sp.]|nr:hypothetical protein [Mucilaginibacter sp.]
MGLLKFIIVGAAVGYGINYLTKKRADGRSVIDDLGADVPEWIDKAKQFVTDNFGDVVQPAAKAS